MRSLVDCIRAEAARARVLEGQPLVVAVSGGLDSVALTHGLRALASERQWTLVIAHLNHRLRGAESDADASFVVELAQSWGIACAVESADVFAYAKARHLSLEMAAREVRHRFLARVAQSHGARWIAVAHHFDDQTELVLLRLLRGAGPQAYGGMTAVAPSPADPTRMLFRPFLGLSRAQLATYAAECGLAYRDDSSNGELVFERNRVRHRLLPWLREEWGTSVDANLQRTAKLIADEAEFVAGCAREWLHSVDRVPFPALHAAVQRQVIKQQLESLHVPARYAWIEALRTNPGVAVMAKPGMRLLNSGNGQIQALDDALPRASDAGSDAFEGSMEGIAGTWEIGDARIGWRREKSVSPASPSDLPGGVILETFDFAAVGSRVVVRRWRPGDRFQPLGWSVAGKLQNQFVNRKIPRERRHSLLMACTAEGEIFWVEGLPPGERFKVREQTEERLIWAVQRLGSAGDSRQ